MFDSLWGEEFNIKEVDPKKLISKVENPKAVVKTVDQLLKSKKTTLDEKLAIITENVRRILGKYAENTQVIRTKEELIKYFDDAIKNNIIALDTETNNSLQPITCKLMGPCLFTPGRKAAYVPINHINKDTRELLSNQLTEEDVAEQLNRLKEAQTKILMHNGKFDYKVFKCTTGVELTVYWDTLLAAKVLDENEEAGLKEQYVKHIDPFIEKYSINHLFAGIEYAIVDPEIFALYAATDAMMTYYLYKWQEERFKLPGCERLFKIFKDVEMPVMPATAEMELTGLEIDKEYTQKLAVKYHKKVDQIDKEIAEAISKYDDLINSWRSKPESNKRPTTYYFDTLKESPTQLDDYKELCAGKIIKGYPKNDANGKGPYKVGKSPSELLENPINLGSPSQLAILLYDIIGVKPPDPKKPRGTGEDELKAIKLPLCKLLLERRGIVKLVDAFIDSLPNEILKETGRVHAGFNQYGAKCIVGDSLIPTPTGVKKIEDFLNNKEIEEDVFYSLSTEIINKNQEVETTSDFIKFENKDTIKIITSGGFELEGTPHHPIMCSGYNVKDTLKNRSNKFIRDFWEKRCFKKLEDLQVGDYLEVPCNYSSLFTKEYQLLNLSLLKPLKEGVCHKNVKMPLIIDEAFAEFLGMYHADGSLKTNNCFRVQISNDDSDVIKRVKELTLQLFNIESTYYVDPRANMNGGSTGFNCTQLANLQLVLTRGAKNKKIQDFIYKSPISVINAYIRGMLLDSSLCKTKGIKLTINDKTDAQFVHMVLAAQGIYSELWNKKSYYSLCIPTSSLEDFNNLIKPVQSEKQQFIENESARKNRKNIIRRIDNSFRVCVRKIERSKNTVYDFTVPNTHSFISNGLISHNTGRYSCSEPNL